MLLYLMKYDSNWWSITNRVLIRRKFFDFILELSRMEGGGDKFSILLIFKILKKEIEKYKKYRKYSYYFSG